MGEAFRWPPEDVEVEAIDFERNAIVSLTMSKPPRGGRDAFRVPPPSGREPSRESRSFAAAEDTRAISFDDTVKIERVAAVAPSRTIRILSRLIPKAVVALLAALVVVEYAWVYRSIVAIVPIWEQKLPPGAASELQRGEKVAEAPPGKAAVASATFPRTTQRRAAAVESPGSVSIPLPIQVHVFEHGRFVGTNDTQISLAPGNHDLEIENQSLRYRTTVSVQVGSGQSVAIDVPLPSGVVSLTAALPAEVFIDGVRQGETPLTDIPVPIGSHQIVFRHARLGEERRSIVVNLDSPLRLSVDFPQ